MPLMLDDKTGTFTKPVIQVSSGGLVSLLTPVVEDILLEDIATATSKLCRFTGQVSSFYSVAQHACWCYDHALDWPREALFHDAAEAYIGDISRPLKLLLEQLQPGLIKGIEQKFEEVIAERLGLTYPWPAEVKRLDNIALATEKRDLLPRSKPGEKWPDMPRPHRNKLLPWSPLRAEEEFMHRVRESQGWQYE